MSINDIADAIEHQRVWASWQAAGRKNLDAERDRERVKAKRGKGIK